MRTLRAYRGISPEKQIHLAIISEEEFLVLGLTEMLEKRGF